MKLIKNKRIAIVGAGPGGLTLARLLQMNDADIKVYERDVNKDVRVQGATLDLHDESGLKALETAGLMDAFKANYRPGADKMRLMDKHANILVDQHEEENEEDFGSAYFRPEIDRGPLRKILLESLEPGTVVWDSHFASMEKDGEGWKLTFKNGSTAEADIVIAADGANSKIRPFITPLKASYSGMTAIEGAVYDAETKAPHMFGLLKDGKIFAFGDEKSLIVSSKGDGSMAFYLGLNVDEDWHKNCGVDFNDNAEVLTWFKKDFAGWDEVWDELFTQGEPKFIPRPQYCMPLDQSWEAQGNITMLGDAAHLMPPYAGEGVNMAMLDALELSECLLSDAADLKTAIENYEQQMLARFAEIGAVTMHQTKLLHSAEALESMQEMFS